MSGEAGCDYLSTWYRASYRSGVRESIALEPQPDGSFVDRSAEHFAAEERAMLRELAPRVAAISALVEDYRRDGRLPLLPAGSAGVHLHEAVTDGDADGRSERALASWGAAQEGRLGLAVETDLALARSGFEHLVLDFCLTRPVSRRVLQALEPDLQALWSAAAPDDHPDRVFIAAGVVEETTPLARMRFTLPTRHWERAAATALEQATRRQAAEQLPFYHEILAQAIAAGLPLVPLDQPGGLRLDLLDCSGQGSMTLSLQAAPGSDLAALREALARRCFDAQRERQEGWYLSLPR